jgi:myo-inositol-1(or 4)-monophosphatase
MGRADAAFIANESFKDLCAVSVIIEAAGGKLLKGDGSAFFLGDYMDGRRIDDLLMIASPSYARAILDSLSHSRG